MGRLDTGENVAGGESSWNLPTSRARNHRYVITRNPGFDTERLTATAEAIAG